MVAAWLSKVIIHCQNLNHINKYENKSLDVNDDGFGDWNLKS